MAKGCYGEREGNICFFFSTHINPNGVNVYSKNSICQQRMSTITRIQPWLYKCMVRRYMISAREVRTKLQFDYLKAFVYIGITVVMSIYLCFLPSSTSCAKFECRPTMYLNNMILNVHLEKQLTNYGYHETTYQQKDQ